MWQWSRRARVGQPGRQRRTVVEIIPGGGWYTKILAPDLRDRSTPKFVKP